MTVTIHGNGAIDGLSYSSLPTGSVVQAVHGLTTIGNAGTGNDFNNYSFNSTAATGLADAIDIVTVNITPRFATSNLLIMYSINPSYDTVAGDIGMDMWLTRDGANVLGSGGNRDTIKFEYRSLNQGSGHDYWTSAGTHMISANTTNQQAISLKANRYNNAAGQVYFRHDGTNSLTVLEISG